MKNEQLKKQFLETVPIDSQELLKSAFLEVEPLEDELNKDCSLFSMDEIDKVFGKQTLDRSRSVAKKCDLLTKYTLWMQQHHPFRYATYSTYAEKHNLYFPGFSIDHLNPARVYTPEEFQDTLDKMSSMYDRMMFLAVYEGIWTSARITDFFLLRKVDLDIKKNMVSLNSGRTMTISDNLMELLQKGADQTNRDGVGVQNSTFDCIMYRDPTICYKRLNIDPKMNAGENKQKIKTHMQNERRSVQKEVSNPDKFTVTNIQMSGMLNALIGEGITRDFNDNRLYEADPIAGAIADRYDFLYRGTQKNNFNRRFEPYFMSAE